MAYFNPCYSKFQLVIDWLEKNGLNQTEPGLQLTTDCTKAWEESMRLAWVNTKRLYHLHMLYGDPADIPAYPKNPPCVGRIPMVKLGTTTFEYLSACKDVAAPDNTNLDAILKRSDEFLVKFPIKLMLCQTLLGQDDVTCNMLEDNINSAYPILHEAALYLFINFLVHKKQHGSAMEKEFYVGMTLTDLVQRLLDKRAMMFFQNTDHLLLDGTTGMGGLEHIGEESDTLRLENCLSYDEMKLSAFLSVSSHSIFINNGKGTNEEKPTDYPESIQRPCVAIGLIGARLSKCDYMERQEMVLTHEQNTANNGYGVPTPDLEGSEKMHVWRKIWASFYGISHFPTYNEVVGSLREGEVKRIILKGGCFVLMCDGKYFNNLAFQKRLSVSIETSLLEAQHRAAVQGTKAFIHVGNQGNRAWMIWPHQHKLFLDTYTSCLKKLAPKLTHVSEVHFSGYFFRDKGDRYGESIKDIRLNFSMMPPTEKLFGSVGRLVVVSYDWDSCVHSFWAGKLRVGGDPAAALSKQIAELHNPHVNCDHVTGRNLRVATHKWGVVHIADYATRKLQ